jgi:hypothetical protein
MEVKSSRLQSCQIIDSLFARPQVEESGKPILTPHVDTIFNFQLWQEKRRKTTNRDKKTRPFHGIEIKNQDQVYKVMMVEMLS